MVTSVDHSTISGAIAKVAFDSKLDSKRVVRMASRRDATEHTVELWHAVDLSDLSTVRTFVVSSCEPEFIYEVDFFSRNEAPKDPHSIPDDLCTWGVVRGVNIIVTDRVKFCSRMAADVFVAIPTYRFEFLADDLQESIETKQSDRPLEWAMTSMIAGYSFRRYDLSGSVLDEFSIASGVLK